LKLTTDTIAQLDQLVQTAMIAGLKKLVIEPGKIRGIDEKQSVVVISTANVPDLSGKQLGITRIDQLSARINLVKTQGDLTIDATESTANSADISLLELSVGKTKAQFRCASVEAVKGVPKNITDTLVWEIKVGGKIIPTITQGISAMGSDHLMIASRDGKTVSFECVDTNKDVFTIDADSAPDWIGDGTAPTSFCQKYPAKTLLALIKEALKTEPVVALRLGEGGILNLEVNKFNFYVIPVA
jgi:3-dehydroquinate synthase class II